MPTYEIATCELRQLVDPLDGQMWKVEPIAESDVRDAIANGVEETRSWEGDDLVNKLNGAEARLFHINRIATLSRERLTDKIVLILENHTDTVRAYLHDGNHRLAAAFLRGDEKIMVLVAASDESKIVCSFPTARRVEANT